MRVTFRVTCSWTINHTFLLSVLLHTQKPQKSNDGLPRLFLVAYRGKEDRERALAISLYVYVNEHKSARVPMALVFRYSSAGLPSSLRHCSIPERSYRATRFPSKTKHFLSFCLRAASRSIKIIFITIGVLLSPREYRKNTSLHRIHVIYLKFTPYLDITQALQIKAVLPLRRRGFSARRFVRLE